MMVNRQWWLTINFHPRGDEHLRAQNCQIHWTILGIRFVFVATPYARLHFGMELTEWVALYSAFLFPIFCVFRVTFDWIHMLTNNKFTKEINGKQALMHNYLIFAIILSDDLREACSLERIRIETEDNISSEYVTSKTTKKKTHPVSSFSFPVSMFRVRAPILITEWVWHQKIHFVRCAHK